MRNHWLDNYTIEGAVKQLTEWIETWTQGVTFATDTAIVDLWDEFFVQHPSLAAFERDIEMDWDAKQAKDGTYWFTNIRIWSTRLIP